MNTNRREKKRNATLDEIRATAWKQIGELGAASLSLRGIAREMGVTAPALYRYYQDRDALVTALLIDAFTAFGSALETAPEFVVIDDITLSEDDVEGGLLQLTLQLSTYFQAAE